MHVQFEFTEDEMVDASRRFLARSGALRSIRWKDTLYVSLAAGVIPLLFFLDRPIMGVTIGGLAALVSAALYRTTGEKEYEKRIRKLSREVLGGRGPHLCEVELSAVGVWVRQGHKQITYEWEGV